VRVLLTGAGGQLGHELVQAFHGHDLAATSRADLDVTDRDAVLATISEARPDVVLHAAAWTAVDDCEGDPSRAHAVNALGTRHVAEAARRVDARVCYFSTDYVFDGTKPDAYTEADVPNPQSVYGTSKLAGEQELSEDPESLIVRISWVCGRHGSNMVKTILRLAGQHDSLRFVDDQRGHPTFAADAAAMVRTLIDQHCTGVYHVTNQGEVTWYEFARAVLASAGLDPARVEPISTAELQPPRPAPRPANSVLDNAALRRAGIPLLPDYRQSLDALVRELVAP
jgi:dTDP-4-dehydrorhamnose reductase